MTTLSYDKDLNNNKTKMILVQVLLGMCILSLIIESGSLGKTATCIWGILLLIMLFANLHVFLLLAVTTILLSSLNNN